jgi:ABC-type phosphate/phosphonate transport system substrate-binding protein
MVRAPEAPGGEMKTVTVRIGLTETLFRDTPAELVQMVRRPFKSLMETQTGLTGDLVMGVPPDELGRQLKDDKVQLAVFQGIEFAWARQKNADLKPLMLAIKKDKYLRAHLVVRADSTAAKLADLKGKSLAIPLRTREHCRVFLEQRCCDAAGKEPKEFFGKITTPIMEEAVDDVATGRVDAVLVDATFLSWYEENKSARFAKLKTVDKSEAFPAAIIAYFANALDEATLRRFRDGMLTAKDNPRGVELMSWCQMTSFEPVPDDYDKLLKDIAKAYPPAKKKSEKSAADR